MSKVSLCVYMENSKSSNKYIGFIIKLLGLSTMSIKLWVKLFFQIHESAFNHDILKAVISDFFPATF